MKSPLLKFMAPAMIGFCAVAGCSLRAVREPQSDAPGIPGSPGTWTLDSSFSYDSGVASVGVVRLRAGWRREVGEAMRGCVLYLEGLGDSMLNHEPYFDALNRAGYRVLAFDYMGQGGSDGSMNQTRLRDRRAPGLEIAAIARLVWEKYRPDCGNSKRMVIGWSTGGLAAYGLAADGWADAVVLVDPAIYPRVLVGESAGHPGRLLTGEPIVTRATLTRNPYADGRDPHVEPIRPDSPTLAPLFTANLLATASVSHRWRIPARVPGLVFLSGKADTYVNGADTDRGLAKRARHFQVHSFPDTLHELDNEMPEVANQIRRQTVEFLDSLRAGR